MDTKPQAAPLAHTVRAALKRWAYVRFGLWAVYPLLLYGMPANTQTLVEDLTRVALLALIHSVWYVADVGACYAIIGVARGCNWTLSGASLAAVFVPFQAVALTIGVYITVLGRMS